MLLISIILLLNKFQVVETHKIINEKIIEFESICKNDRLEKYYDLALLKNKEIEGGYSIHGLWPEYDKKHYPSYCHKTEFYEKEIQPIEDLMHKYWRSTIKPRNDTYFWEHEWKKHGVCMYEKMTEFEYFNKTLSLFFQAQANNFFEECPNYYINNQNTKSRGCMLPLDLNFKFII